MNVFWQRGYDATSMDDIVRASGVGKQSLYDTFGDKRALYLAALDLYATQRAQLLRDALDAPGSPRAALVALLRNLAKTIGDPAQPGCMLTDAAADACVDDEAVQQCIARGAKVLEKTIRTLLERAEEAGEIRPDQNLRAKARGLVATVSGLRLVTRPTGDARMLADILDDALARIA